MPKPLQLQLFGTPQISYLGQPLSGFVSGKVRALLIYLAVTARPQSRTHLAEFFWADTPASSRVNLRKALSNLRGLVGDVLREDGKESILLDPQQVWVDVIEFAQLVKQEREPEALQLYHADFLSGFNFSLSYEFETWALSEQSRLKTQYVDLLRRLATQQEADHKLGEAISTVRHLLQLEPWHEEAHRWLMELLARDGQRSAALAHFEIAKRVLKEELEVAPSEETLNLLARIQHSVDVPAKPRPKTSSIPKPEFPLIGREQELQTIQSAWEKCMQAGPHFVCIAGEAGIGKTRLTEEVRLWVAQQGYVTAYARSYAAEGSLAYSPVVDWLRSEAIRSSLEQLEPVWLNEVARLLPELLKGNPHLAHPKPITDGLQRRYFFEALARAIFVGDQPLLLVIDDLQWCDRETLEWLRFLLRFEPNYPLLLIGAYRVDEVTPDHPLQTLQQTLRREDAVTELELGMLKAADTISLINMIASDPVSPENVAALWKATAGQPLFVIESVRNKAGGKDSSAIPLKVQNVIQARLAQLSPDSIKIVEVASAIGRQFTTELLAHACQQSYDEIITGLNELCQRKIFVSINQETLDFSHDRIREVGYRQIPSFQLSSLHHKIAQAYEILYAERLDGVCGQIAYHFAKAGRNREAFHYFYQAGKVGKRLNAYTTMIGYLEQALGILPTISADEDVALQEMEILENLGTAYKSVDGYQSASSEAYFVRLKQVAERSGNLKALADALSGLRAVYQNRAEFDVAIAHSERLLAIAEQLNDPSYSGNAHNLYAASHFHLGNLAQAWQHFEKAKQFEYPHVYIRSTHTAWLLGYPELARQRATKGIQLKREQNDANDIVWSLSMARNLEFMMHDFATMTSRIAEFSELATKYGLTYFLNINHLFEGWQLAEEGYVNDAIAKFEKGLRCLEETQAWQFYSDRCGMVAESLGRSGLFAKALTFVDRALAFVERSGERFWQAELLRQKGQFLIGGYQSIKEGEASFRCSLTIAREQAAKSLELRTSVSLARLWQSQGKHVEAYQLLAPIYGWFTEGFDTVDLVEAKSLLHELIIRQS